MELVNAEEMTSEIEINDVVKYLRPQNEKEANPWIECRRSGTGSNHQSLAADSVEVLSCERSKTHRAAPEARRPAAKQYDTREQRLRAFCEVVKVLATDVKRHMEASHNFDEPFARRGLVRCVCAYIEGVSYVMKQTALLEHQEGPSVFSFEEIMLLSERAVDLRDNGKLEMRRTKLHTLPNIRFALASFAKAQQVKLNLNFEGSEWAALHKAFNVRDQLMHPREITDLDVSDEEAQSARDAHRWFQDAFVSLLTQTPAKNRVENLERTVLYPLPIGLHQDDCAA